MCGWPIVLPTEAYSKLEQLLSKLKSMETSLLSTRAATIDDVPVLSRLIQELAKYERESQGVLITEDELRRDGFDRDRKFRAIIAEQDGQPVGFAVFFTCYSIGQVLVCSLRTSS
jgi:hypothetical protein